MTEDVVVEHEVLRRFVAAIYEAAGTPSDNASIVAAHQAGANLVGHDSHGIQLLPSYLDRIELGHIVPDARPEVMGETPASLFVNGHWGFGPVVSEWTTQRVIEKARTVGIAFASIREQSHVGRLADYPLMAADAGLIGIMMCDSGQGPKQVVPFGGREARLGTNPVCIALPSDLPGPVFIDMATSAAAAAKLKVARARNLPVPGDWLIDRDGNPSSDPNAFFAGGALLPLGGAVGHKGYGLSFMIEALAAILPGLGYGIDPKGRHNDGALIIVLDPAAVRPAAEFRADVADFATYLKETPLADGFSEVLYPGELEHRTEATRRRAGIPIEPGTWAEVSERATRLGVEPPALVSAA